MYNYYVRTKKYVTLLCQNERCVKLLCRNKRYVALLCQNKRCVKLLCQNKRCVKLLCQNKRYVKLLCRNKRYVKLLCNKKRLQEVTRSTKANPDRERHFLKRMDDRKRNRSVVRLTELLTPYQPLEVRRCLRMFGLVLLYVHRGEMAY